jgi:mRNA interferase RelE/StbE
VYNLKYDKTVIKFLQKHDKAFALKVLDIFDAIALDPFENTFDIKPLQGMKNHYRLRVSKYRFLYEVFNQELLIYCYDADTRGDIYK